MGSPGRDYPLVCASIVHLLNLLQGFFSAQPTRKPSAEVSSSAAKPSPAQPQAAPSPGNANADAKNSWMNGGAAAAAMAKGVADNQAKHQSSTPASKSARDSWMNGGATSALAKVVAENQAKHADAKKHDVVLREIFDLADVDRSGFLDADELLLLGQATNPKFTEQKCKSLMKEMDTSKDQKVDVHEFLQFANHFDKLDATGIQRMRDAAEALSKKAKASHQQPTVLAPVPAAVDYLQPDLKEPLRLLFNTLDSSSEGYIGAEELTIFIRLTDSSLPAAWKAKMELASFRVRQSEFIEAFTPALKEKSLRRARQLATHIFRVKKDDRMKLVEAFHDCEKGQSGSGSIDVNVLQQLTMNTDVNKRDRTLGAIQHAAGEPITLDVFLAYFGWHLDLMRPEGQARELANISTQASKQAALRSMMH